MIYTINKELLLEEALTPDQKKAFEQGLFHDTAASIVTPTFIPHIMLRGYGGMKVADSLKEKDSNGFLLGREAVLGEHSVKNKNISVSDVYTPHVIANNALSGAGMGALYGYANHDDNDHTQSAAMDGTEMGAMGALGAGIVLPGLRYGLGKILK